MPSLAFANPDSSFTKSVKDNSCRTPRTVKDNPCRRVARYELRFAMSVASDSETIVLDSELPQRPHEHVSAAKGAERSPFFRRFRDGLLEAVSDVENGWLALAAGAKRSPFSGGSGTELSPVFTGSLRTLHRNRTLSVSHWDGFTLNPDSVITLCFLRASSFAATSRDSNCRIPGPQLFEVQGILLAERSILSGRDFVEGFVEWIKR